MSEDASYSETLATLTNDGDQNGQTPEPQAKSTAKKLTLPRSGKASKELRELVKGLFLRGIKPTDIAKQTGVNTRTQRTWISRFKWKDLKLTVQANAESIQGERLSGVIRQPANELLGQSSRIRSLIGEIVERQVKALTTAETTPQALRNTPLRQGDAAVLKTITETASKVFDWESHRTPGLVIIGEVERLEPEEPEPAIDIESSVEPDSELIQTPQ